MKNKTIKALTLAGVIAMGCAATTAQAHPLWLLPSHFTVSKEGGDWLTFDVTASHGTFVFDKPAGAERALIYLPDGKKERPNYVIRGKRRSVFDFYFEQEGTHKVELEYEPMYITSYKAGKRDTAKRMRANKLERVDKLPESARDASTMMMVKSALSYITVGKPTETVFKMDGKLLEFKPITHPADIVEQEPVTFQFYFNGKPQQGVKAEITRDGTLYRNQQEQIDVVSNDKGEITFTPEHAGRYLMKASYKGKLTDNAMADSAMNMMSVSFEAVLQ